MATLTGNAINTSYQGLIKLDDNGAVQPTALKTLTDGTGGTLPIQFSQVETKFTSGSLVDFTGVTVSGLPASSAGLVAGAAANSMESSASLTTTAANAITPGSIAIGDGAIAGATAFGDRAAIAIGKNAVASTDFGDSSIAIGFDVKNVRDAGIAIGRNLNQPLATNDHFRPINIGSGGNVRGGDVIGIGTNIDIQGTATNDKIAIGTNAIVTDVTGAVALGSNVTASKANTVSVKELETTVVGGGIIMYSPNGTGYKLTVSDAGAPVFTAI